MPPAARRSRSRSARARPGPRSSPAAAVGTRPCPRGEQAAPSASPTFATSFASLAGPVEVHRIGREAAERDRDGEPRSAPCRGSVASASAARRSLASSSVGITATTSARSPACSPGAASTFELIARTARSDKVGTRPRHSPLWVECGTARAIRTPAPAEMSAPGSAARAATCPPGRSPTCPQSERTKSPAASSLAHSGERDRFERRGEQGRDHAQHRRPRLLAGAGAPAQFPTSSSATRRSSAFTASPPAKQLALLVRGLGGHRKHRARAVDQRHVRVQRARRSTRHAGSPAPDSISSKAPQPRRRRPSRAPSPWRSPRRSRFGRAGRPRAPPSPRRSPAACPSCRRRAPRQHSDEQQRCQHEERQEPGGELLPGAPVGPQGGRQDQTDRRHQRDQRWRRRTGSTQCPAPASRGVGRTPSCGLILPDGRPQAPRPRRRRTPRSPVTSRRRRRSASGRAR